MQRLRGATFHPAPTYAMMLPVSEASAIAQAIRDNVSDAESFVADADRMLDDGHALLEIVQYQLQQFNDVKDSLPRPFQVQLAVLLNQVRDDLLLILRPVPTTVATEESRDVRIETLTRAGLTDAAIGAMLGTSGNAIKKRRRRLGIIKRANQPMNLETLMEVRNCNLVYA